MDRRVSDPANEEASSIEPPKSKKQASALEAYGFLNNSKSNATQDDDDDDDYDDNDYDDVDEEEVDEEEEEEFSEIESTNIETSVQEMRDDEETEGKPDSNEYYDINNWSCIG